jgi:hypothetical protein
VRLMSPATTLRAVFYIMFLIILIMADYYDAVPINVLRWCVSFYVPALWWVDATVAMVTTYIAAIWLYSLPCSGLQLLHHQDVCPPPCFKTACLDLFFQMGGDGIGPCARACW